MTPKRTVAIIQARMASTRLPGKVLLPLGGATVIDCVIARVEAAEGIDAICVAIPVGDRDEPLARHLSKKPGVSVVRGSENDVLDRYMSAATASDAGIIVRITSDSPMIDPRVVSAVVAMQRATGAAYAATALETGYPAGCDAEAFTRAALTTAHAEARDQYEREHVTPFLWRRPERFPAVYLDRKPDLRTLRMTLDTPEDYEFVSAVYARLGQDPLFGVDAVVGLLAREPKLAEVNRGVKQTPYEFGGARR